MSAHLDDRVLSRALTKLLAMAGLDPLWNENGPSAEAVLLLEAGRGSLTVSEPTLADIALLRIAFCLWDDAAAPGPGVAVGEIIRRDGVMLQLDRRIAEAVISLVRACLDGNEAVASWSAPNAGGGA